MGAAIDTYRECAQKVAALITDPTTWTDYIAPDNNNFWRIANAFSTLIDYFVITGHGNLMIGESTYDAFHDKNHPGWWYDDYSWWIVALLRAAEYNQFVGDYKTSWKDLARTCWTEMSPATQVWAKADQRGYARAEPRFGGGCWNHDFAPGASEPSQCNPLKSTDRWPVCAIQNTVTNTQYLVSAARLLQADDAKRQYGWLRRWFSDPSLAPDQSLLAGGDDWVLVRERVSTFAQQDGTYPQAPNHDKDRHWAGDQGILLGALLEMISLDPPGQSQYLGNARRILEGVRTRLVDDRQILQPWMPADSIDQTYYSDYLTGIGVFMRYLLYVYNSDNPTLRQYVSSPQYKAFIQANADAACQAIGDCPPFPNGRPADQMECLLNQLSVLNAAVAILT